jgi:hypothetical protein
MASFPMDITLEEAIMDFSSDKDSTLTRKSNQTDPLLDISDSIPFLTLEGNTNVTSRSSSSSTISHSNSGVLSSATSTSRQTTTHQVTNTDTHSLNSSGNAIGNQSNGGILLSEIANCDVESTHMHVTCHDDDMLDSILKSLESHYGVQKQRKSSQNSLTSTPHKSDIVVSSQAGDKAVKDITEEDPESPSGSISNPELSDIETTPREEDGEDTCEAPEARERRDSGVGSSLTREPRLVISQNIVLKFILEK